MIKNLIFGASGSKIFIHLGFIKYLIENNLINEVNRFIGTSGGSIVAFLLSLGYNIEIITELFLELDSEKLKKINSDSVLNFFDNYGLDDGKNMERALRIILKQKHNSNTITFKEIYEKYGNYLVICSVNLQKHEQVFFDYESYPDLDVVDAVMMSLSIPLMFTPRKFNDEIYVDGGLMCTYPIEYIELNNNIKREECLGLVMISEHYICRDNTGYDFMFCKKEENTKIEINTFENYIFNILSCSSIKMLKTLYFKYRDITVLVFNNDNGFILLNINNL